MEEEASLRNPSVPLRRSSDSLTGEEKHKRAGQTRLFNAIAPKKKTTKSYRQDGGCYKTEEQRLELRKTNSIMTSIIHLDTFRDRTFAFYTVKSVSGNRQLSQSNGNQRIKTDVRGAQRLQDTTLHHCWHLKLNTGGWKTDTFNYLH